MLLGLLPPHVDPRTIPYASVRDGESTWTAPASWSFDVEHPGVPTPVFNNDIHGNCVIAAEGHATLRFELLEQGRLVPGTAAEVDAEYFRQSGGHDSGLVLLYAMREWRKGFKFGGGTYAIHSFLLVNRGNTNEVREAMLVGAGLTAGVDLPLSASDDMNAGRTWDIVAGPRGAKGSWGRHAIRLVGYGPDGVEFITWGKRQRATWRWFSAMCEECYLVIDDVDRLATVDHPLDPVALVDAVRRIA